MTNLRQSKEVQELQKELNEAISKYGANCDGYTEEFYANPEDLMSLRMAKFICDTCPIKQICQDYAIAAEEEYGVWGGLTAEDRKWIFTNRKRAARRERYLRTKENPYQE
jgi:hypothetical protein